MAGKDKKPKKRKVVDWDAVEKEWCLDQLSNRQLSKKYGPAHTTIARRAEKGGWCKDKGDEVRRKTRAALLSDKDGAVKCTSPTQEDISGAVKNNVEMIREHRKDISNGRSIVKLLSSQLLLAADLRDEIEDDIERETKEDSNSKRRTRMLKAVSIQSHASTLRDLTTAMKNLIPLERQAFNVDGKDTTQEENDNDSLSDTARAARVAAILDKARDRRAGQSDNE